MITYTNFAANDIGLSTGTGVGGGGGGKGGDQSCTQSLQALWPAVGRQERVWGTGILFNLIGFSVTACIVLLQKSCGNRIPVPRSLS